MARKKITQEKIINSFLFSSFDKSAGATSLQDISTFLEIKKASLYNHFTSKDEMYDATINYCKEYLDSFNFIPNEIKLITVVENQKIFSLLKKLINRYIKLYEAEPLFQIYTFIHTEKYYNKNASSIAESEYKKIYEGISDILKIYSDYNKIKKLSTEEIESKSKIIASILLNQLDFYIFNKKEIVRQNPESGVGSLFALPTDDKALSSIIKIIESFTQDILI